MRLIPPYLKKGALQRFLVIHYRVVHVRIATYRSLNCVFMLFYMQRALYMHYVLPISYLLDERISTWVSFR